MTVLTIFTLRQKVYRFRYTHFDVSNIYKSLKCWSAITLNLNKKNQISEWSNGTTSPTSTEFSVLSYDYFLLKKDILGLAMRI